MALAAIAPYIASALPVVAEAALPIIKEQILPAVGNKIANIIGGKFGRKTVSEHLEQVKNEDRPIGTPRPPGTIEHSNPLNYNLDVFSDFRPIPLWAKYGLRPSDLEQDEEALEGIPEHDAKLLLDDYLKYQEYKSANKEKRVEKIEKEYALEAAREAQAPLEPLSVYEKALSDLATHKGRKKLIKGTQNISYQVKKNLKKAHNIGASLGVSPDKLDLILKAAEAAGKVHSVAGQARLYNKRYNKRMM